MRTAAALFTLLSAAAGVFAEGSGEPSASQGYPLSGFTRIQTGYGIIVDVVQSASFGVALQADPELL